MKPLPDHLKDMTQAKWDAMTPAQRKAARDMSEVHPLLHTYIGQRIKVSPKRERGASTFTVGITSGWRPVLLAVRGNASGSSDTIRADEVFTCISRA